MKVSDAFGNETTGFMKLFFVITVCSHRERNAVRRESYLRALAALFWNLIERGADVFNIWLNEARMVVEGAQLVNFRNPFAYLRPRFCDVLEVLAATGVPAVCGCDECQSELASLVTHRTQGIGAQTVLPVPAEGRKDRGRSVGAADGDCETAETSPSPPRG